MRLFFSFFLVTPWVYSAEAAGEIGKELDRTQGNLGNTAIGQHERRGLAKA